MRGYSESAWERAMKVQEVILRAMAKRINWWQAAEVAAEAAHCHPPNHQRIRQTTGQDFLTSSLRVQKLTAWTMHFAHWDRLMTILILATQLQA